MSDPILRLIRKVVEERKTTKQWKVARIIPLFKKGDKKKTETYYCLISNLCSITNVYERLLLKKVQNTQEKEQIDLTATFQHGFKKNFSTKTLFLEINTNFSRICDAGNYATVSSLELSAAFDVVE